MGSLAAEQGQSTALRLSTGTFHGLHNQGHAPAFLWLGLQFLLFDFVATDGAHVVWPFVLCYFGSSASQGAASYIPDRLPAHGTSSSSAALAPSSSDARDLSRSVRRPSSSSATAQGPLFPSLCSGSAVVYKKQHCRLWMKWRRIWRRHCHLCIQNRHFRRKGCHLWEQMCHVQWQSSRLCEQG